MKKLSGFALGCVMSKKDNIHCVKALRGILAIS